MDMSSEGFLVMLLVGFAAGWLAGKFVDGTGYGLLGDVTIGIIGAFIGNWLLPGLGLYFSVWVIGAIVNATIGAVVLLLVIRLVRRGRNWGGGWTNGWNRRWGSRW
jgi:uncharacterized membrane protein YeaQ/YmgE (transglycosylase-associated protein family)